MAALWLLIAIALHVQAAVHLHRSICAGSAVTRTPKLSLSMATSILDTLEEKATTCYDVSMQKFSSGSDYQTNAKPQMGTWIDSTKLDELTQVFNDLLIDKASGPYKDIVTAHNGVIEKKVRGGNDSPSIVMIRLLGNEQKFSLNLYVVQTGQQLPPRRHDPGTVLLFRVVKGSGRLKSIVNSRVIQDDLLENIPLSLMEKTKEGDRSATRALSRIGGPVRIFSAQTPSLAKYDLADDNDANDALGLEGAVLLEMEIYPPDHLRTDQSGDTTGAGFYVDSNDSVFDQQPFALGEMILEMSPRDLTDSGRTLLASAASHSGLPMSGDNSSSKASRKSARAVPSGADISAGLRASVGGLSKEIDDIVRRVLSSRSMPSAVMAALGLQHVRGLLLHGPPGTGKTLVARQIAAALNAREPKIVNGPELLDKFVGEAERRVRELFADAEEEWRLAGPRSQLHVIVFDEFDAIAKRRGSLSSDGSGVRDSVVNQLLSKMDGMEQVGNILVIALTNRKELIDGALLRPGRLEVHVEIKAPDLLGRVEILFILFRPLIACGVIERSDAASLALRVAKETYGRTGADLAGVLRSAASFALQRHCSSIGTGGGEAALDEEALMAGLRLNYGDFKMALEETLGRVGPLGALRSRIGGVKGGGPALEEALRRFAEVPPEPYSRTEDAQQQPSEQPQASSRPGWTNLGGSLMF